jgi:DNA mismatch repair ATPase MutL
MLSGAGKAPRGSSKRTPVDLFRKDPVLKSTKEQIRTGIPLERPAELLGTEAIPRRVVPPERTSQSGDADTFATLSRSQISGASLIGQWASKFILCAVPGATATLENICIVDQHALHERIRLEYFIAHVEQFTTAAPIASIRLSRRLERAVRARLLSLKHWGWNFREGEDSVLHLTHVPRISVEGFVYDVSEPHSLEHACEELPPARSDAAGELRSVVPSAILSILISRSCRRGDVQRLPVEARLRLHPAMREAHPSLRIVLPRKTDDGVGFRGSSGS